MSTTLNGIVEKVEHAMGLLEAAVAYLPGDSPIVQRLRALILESHQVLAISDVRVALAEVETTASAKAQEIADNWPDEPTQR